MTADPLRRALLGAGKLKLAARARLAEGGADAQYEAAVLYHAAARDEGRALLAMEAPSPEARLGSAIERCACLIEGFDAMAVLDVGWADVLAASAAVAPETAAAMRVRVDAKLSDMLARYQRVLAKTPTLKAWMERNGPWAALRAMGRELDRFLRAFPGAAGGWAMRSAAHLEAGDVSSAWACIRRARALTPEDTMFAQQELHILPMHLPRADAEARLEGVHALIERGEANADICFGFVSACMQLARASKHREKLLRQALDAAMLGFRVQPQWHDDRKMFRVMELSLREMLAGRRPTADILYRCGLGRFAATAGAQVDPMAFVLALRRPEAA